MSPKKGLMNSLRKRETQLSTSIVLGLLNGKEFQHTPVRNTGRGLLRKITHSWENAGDLKRETHFGCSWLFF